MKTQLRGRWKSILIGFFLWLWGTECRWAVDDEVTNSPSPSYKGLVRNTAELKERWICCGNPRVSLLLREVGCSLRPRHLRLTFTSAQQNNNTPLYTEGNGKWATCAPAQHRKLAQSILVTVFSWLRWTSTLHCDLRCWRETFENKSLLLLKTKRPDVRDCSQCGNKHAHKPTKVGKSM